MNIRFSLIAFLLLSFSVQADNNPTTHSAVFAGGCFWCIEADFEKLTGVTKVESGYTGGSNKNASYRAVTKGGTGHFEAVKVWYEPEQVSYAQLVDYFWRHIDPTDAKGQFCDKGASYRSAIFYDSEAQKSTIDASLEQLKTSTSFGENIVTQILPAMDFYRAEEYHQNYYKKNPLRYQTYRLRCGRDRRVKQVWGE